MQKICRQCKTSFEITDQDLSFYDKISPVFAGKKYSIPPPTLCPDCRYQRRLNYRNERNLYHRKCDLTGKAMIAMYPTDTPFPVYYIKDWLTDKWDPRDYAQEFDFSKPFFEQFQALTDRVPHFSLFIDPFLDVNSEFTNCASESKNCYMISQAEKNEDCYYSRGINNSRNCCDCLRVNDSELCYEAVSANNCYNCSFVQDCDNCFDCHFSSQLRGCKNCFGCHGLVQKEYYIFNQPVSREVWQEKVKNLQLTSGKIEDIKTQSQVVKLTVPHRSRLLINCENSTGDNLLNCKNTFDSFDVKNAEDCRYCNEVFHDAKDAYDFCMFGENCELLYECCGCGLNVHNCLFTSHCWQNVSNLIYCESCFPSVSNCLGCFGLKKAQYCILNKQYSKQEYENLLPRIIEYMKKNNEWGEFFPSEISAFAYNESLAGQFFPLTKAEVLSRGWRWRDEEFKTKSYLGPQFTIPESIADVDDSICQQILLCEVTGKPYKIIPQELAFYKKMNLPIPRKCPDQRHKERLALRNPRKLFDRTCSKCAKAIKTTYAPNRPEIVYCEECYLKEVY